MHFDEADRPPATDHRLPLLILLSERALLPFSGFLDRAVGDLAHLDGFFVFGERVVAKFLEVIDAAKQHMAPLYEPLFGIRRGIVNGLVIVLDGLFKAIMLRLYLV